MKKTMDENFTFSIITPCFNSEKTIERTLQSVLDQSYQNFEYIVIDGGSTDNTLEIIQKYRPAFGDRIRVVSERDNGIYDAMNKGIRMATGDLVGIVNSDDYYEPDCLWTIAECYHPSEGRYQILYGGMRCRDETGLIQSEVFFHHDFLREQMINHPASFVTRALYDHFGMYDTQYKSAADLDFFLKMQRESSIKFVPVRKILTNFSSGGISGSYTGVKETLSIQYKHGIISKKSFLINRVKIWIKRLLKE